ncbi:hypothetical protein LTR05_001916 [Lithohypha guttulata]|uniref:Uncharacterized protein n=1 Tax=Lithohypha guttulata TaxID=1690604 RepID=A0AAN7TA13_9EURO|nr:hypothetical protein LTR05_001916 [Lithohypha guttulata]
MPPSSRPTTGHDQNNNDNDDPIPTERNTGQSISRLSFHALTISSLLVALLAILIALFHPSFSCANTSLKPTFSPSPIPISKVLKQNLALAKHPREHGVLTHALLELQNPELTVFAGPGYGVDLRNPFRGEGGRVRGLEAFPEGMLPRCGGGGSGGGWGRYDEWTRVKGLRYAASKVRTTGNGRRMSSVGGDGWGKEERKQWLIESEDAADAASLGWATLLLERAGAIDVSNPVGVGRNAYGEAADEMVRYLVEDNAKFILKDNAVAGGSLDVGSKSLEKDQPLRRIGQSTGKNWAISHRTDSVQLWADFVFMVPPFLAAYAVARQDERWLREAVEQIRAYKAVLDDSHFECKDLDNTSFPINPTHSSAVTSRKGLWRHIVSQPRDVGQGECCHDEAFWLTGNAWALAGITRVLGVIERWEAPRSTAKTLNSQIKSDKWRASTELLKGMVSEMLSSLVSQNLDTSALLKNYLNTPGSEATQWAFGDAAGSALVASSVYRLAQLGALNDPGMLSWADQLYDVVAKHISADGLLRSVATMRDVPSRYPVNATSEGQSFAIMMYAARRDCAKLGICS